MTAPLASWSSVLHSCRVRVGFFDEAVTHAVTPSHGPDTGRICDFEDAGFDVVGIAILPSAIGGCDYDDPGGRHVLLRRKYPL